MGGGRQDAGAGSADGMPERDAGAVRVEPLVERIDLPFGQNREHLRGEGFVQFDEIDVVQCQLGLGRVSRIFVS